mmetsp:Transcript_74454/g.140411  ORF Transcript_74454/g.140411 Transcript_74454/m.140411 type:complete len:218 (-) Transcript_74454:211-864(-)
MRDYTQVHLAAFWAFSSTFSCFLSCFISFLRLLFERGSPAASSVGMPSPSRAPKLSSRSKSSSYLGSKYSCRETFTISASLAAAAAFAASLAAFFFCASAANSALRAASAMSTFGSPIWTWAVPEPRSSTWIPRGGSVSSRSASHMLRICLLNSTALPSPPPSWIVSMAFFRSESRNRLRASATSSEEAVLPAALPDAAPESPAPDVAMPNALMIRE